MLGGARARRRRRGRFGPGRQTKAGSHRDLNDDSAELHFVAQSAVNPNGPVQRSGDEPTGKVPASESGPMDPGREARVHLEQPPLPARIADHLDLASAGPLDLGHELDEGLGEIGIDLVYGPCPRFSLIGDSVLRHRAGTGENTLVRRERHRLFDPYNVCLQVQIVGAPYLLQAVSHAQEVSPAQHALRLIERTL